MNERMQVNGEKGLSVGTSFSLSTVNYQLSTAHRFSFSILNSQFSIGT